ncbi:terminase [Longimicrobium sp.]|uniref:terminase n=1 Tax=Longimicrobium sp. TaxID=2029185 RepID=UPI002E318CF7|nr:terminase [Longimicrobium sp.]HEX6038905.1 terminase [Longimicrobium sp.]
MASPARVELELADEVAKFYADPLGYVLFAYPWREPGTPLADHDGPDKWQAKALKSLGEQVKARRFDGLHPVAPIRAAYSSGHGIGKTTFVAWVVNWIMSTRPHAHGTITANTYVQLETKTWAAIKRWTGLCITSHWFQVGDHRMYHVDHKDSWFCAPQSPKEENSEAFAGQHAADSTSFYVFDEDSAIPDKIHEVAEGGLTDGEPMIFLFGNPTRNSGHFHRACFGAERNRWNPTVIDSRTSRFTNKAQIQEWIDVYGEDSDFVRVRVKGLPPRASELQFIDQGRVFEAQKRPTPAMFGDEPLVCGVDVSDGGSAWNVIRFRRGADARSIPPVRVPGEKVRGDRSAFLAVLAEVLNGEYGGQRVQAMFVDSAFGAPYVERLQAMGFKQVQEVRFGAESPDHHQANLRAYMWHSLKEWLLRGAIDPKDVKLETDLTAPGYHINKQDKLVIESKEDMAKRGVDSPDDGDALALTFAAQVGRVSRPKRPGPGQPAAWTWA